jgi:hypothetical protein
MGSTITSPQSSSTANTRGPVAQPFSLLHPISQSSLVHDLEGLLPTRRRAIQLWQAFVLNVDPIFKVLHIPTVQPIVYAAINDSHDVEPDLRALLFAIYFSGLTSISRDVANCMNQDHQVELEKYKQGMEASLSQADFLDQPTIQSLQAMTIFVSSFRRFGSGRSIWTINGILIRAAQLMGIHRDGKLFNLSPFDQEMRHRLWWKIISNDSRTLEDQGMWIHGNRSLGDARLPLNIDDRDISPQTTTMPPERTGFSEATPLIAISHILVAGESVAQLSLCADLESFTKKLPTAQEAITQTRALLDEKLFCDYNPHIPIQRLFRNGTQDILDKLEWQCQERLFRLQRKSARGDPQGQHESHDATSDRLFARACDLLDKSLDLVLNEMYTSYTWHTSSYLPNELLTFILWHMYTNPTQASTERAWQLVSQTFSIMEESSVLSDMGTRWNILSKLKEKVASLRENAQDNLRMMDSIEHNSLDTGAGADTGEQGDDGHVSLEERMGDSVDPLFSMDWTTFQQSFSMEGMFLSQL